MKRKTIPIILVFGIIATSVLSLFGLGFINHDKNHFCPFSAMRGSDCSPIKNTITWVGEHLAWLKLNTQSVISQGIGLLIIFALILFSLALVFKKFSLRFGGQFLPRQKSQEILNSILKSKRQFLRWLALHEKRDPSIFTIGV